MTKIKHWHPDHFARKIPFLQKRAEIMRRIRQFFDHRGYLEVETPALQISPGMEPHIKAFETSYTTPDQSHSQQLFLHTSPEFAMKKLLVGGCTQIYQICKTFRNAEDSPHHSPEFTMMEWYHTGMDYTELMQECIDLLRAVHDGPYKFQGRVSDAQQGWQMISVCESFQLYAGIDLESCLPETEDALDKLKAAAPDFYHDGDNWEDLFFRIFLEKIEPHLGHPVPTILYDYPISMAALARPKASDPRFCERFEIYLCGLELANAFGELCDAQELEDRFINNMAIKRQLYGDDYPVDIELIEALSFGMDNTSGIALGIDRLVMAATDATTINDIIAAEIPVK
ncbi:MAG: EF-P lysine aminoacylase EpmA [Pseudomonadota bacterium]